MARIEADGLGPRELPDTALYGVNTQGGERLGITRASSLRWR
ncbi:hypothetical protein [Paenirhodobacter sp.]